VPQVPADYRPLKGSERTARSGAKRTAAADPREVLTVSVRVRRRPDAPELPDLAFATPVPPRGRPYLTRQEFADRYGASDDDFAKVKAFADANGLSVVESSVARRTIVLKGTVAQMNKAFAVDLGSYEADNEKYRGREGPLHLPNELSDIVQGVFGLDNRKMLEPHIRESEVAADAFGPNGTRFMTAPQVAQLYNFPTWPATGQTIAILEFQAGYYERDLQLFFDSVGLPVPSIDWVSVDGQPNRPRANKETTETALDIQVAGSAAPGARLVVYIGPDSEQGLIDAVTTAIHDAVYMPSVISISYGGAELDKTSTSNWTKALINSAHAAFQEAALLGVTVLASSGDQGTQAMVTDGKAHVEYPASDPYVTAVGGTSISNVSGTSFTEFTWPYSGGGISDFFRPPDFPLPPWQSFARVPASVNDGRNGRGVPDIAGNADGHSGYIIYLSGGPSFAAYGGTSASTPLYAALVALLNAGLGENLGYLNPMLYALPSFVFRDIADGQSNSYLGSPGYVSGPGWDACTGLGVVNGMALKYALQGGIDALSLLTVKQVRPD
jgi:subtilase family serine protease